MAENLKDDVDRLAQIACEAYGAQWAKDPNASWYPPWEHLNDKGKAMWRAAALAIRDTIVDGTI